MKTIEIKIPENTQFEKAEVIGGMLVTSFKEVEEFKRGDILYVRLPRRAYIIDYSHIDSKTLYFKHSALVVGCEQATGNNPNGLCYRDEVEEIRLATNSEKQLLFNALAKEGKYWDAEALEIKEYLKVPESIGIYKDHSIFSERYGDGLSISFNEGKQLLRVDVKEDIYIVDCLLRLRGNNKTKCYLQPTDYKDLKVGDTFFCSLRPDFDNLNKYYKKLADTQCRVGNNNHDVILTDFDLSMGLKFYKLIPIQ